FAKQEAGIQERPVQMVPPVGSGSKPPVILVADNDPAVKERIEPFLSHAGYEVVIAASAQEALRKAVQLQPLAVLIDTQLPPNGGSGLVYDLRRESKTKDIPIVLTSKVNKESLPFDIGQADFLTKPIDRQQLLQMMVKFDLLADGKRGKKTPSSILIVDDDPQNIRLVKAMLKPFNMEVMVADGGKAGLELALKKKPDLIILDLMMPGVDRPRRPDGGVQRRGDGGYPEEANPALRTANGGALAGARPPGRQRLDPPLREPVLELALPALRAGRRRGRLPLRPLGRDRHQPVLHQRHHPLPDERPGAGHLGARFDPPGDPYGRCDHRPGRRGASYESRDWWYPAAPGPDGAAPQSSGRTGRPARCATHAQHRYPLRHGTAADGFRCGCSARRRPRRLYHAGSRQP